MMPMLARSIVVRARPPDRTRNLVLVGALTAWMLCTRFYVVLHGAHATLPANPLYTFTGVPCPLCGGTRGFAYLWRGDLGHAMLLHPLASALFGGTIVAIAAFALALATGRDIRMPKPAFRVALAVGAMALVASWALKLTVLPN
jgi:hypothetical protein